MQIGIEKHTMFRHSFFQIFLNYVVFALFLSLVSCIPKVFEDDTDLPPPPASEGNLPHIYIVTDDSAAIDSREQYVGASIVIDGKGNFDDYRRRTQIRGRGNTTWNMPKKPYKLKLYFENALFGLSPHKEWVLLAEYLDGTLLYNSIPFTAAQMLGMPYTNTVIPTQLTINGEYQGFYAFTENKSVDSERIAIGEDGVLLEMDTNFNEEWQFISAKYKLPVMVKYPRTKHGITESKFEEIKTDFENLEALVFSSSFPNNDYLDYFDALAFVNYMIVYQLTLNKEINHPKSTFIHKNPGGKYRMGIVWDFDWGFGYDYGTSHYDIETASESIFEPEYFNYKGTKFFKKIMTDPEIQKLLKQRWIWFKANKYDDLRNAAIQYSMLVDEALHKDHEVWGDRGSTGDVDTDLNRLLDWLDARAEYLDSYVVDFPD